MNTTNTTVGRARARAARPVVHAREQLSSIVERAMALLDALDDDPDSEPTGDAEPTLGWPEARDARPARLSPEGFNAQTLDGELEEEEDRELSLGWAGVFEGSALLLEPSPGDREQDAGDEGEPDEDGEPTLGWPNWTAGRGSVPLSLAGQLVDGQDGESEDGGDREPEPNDGAGELAGGCLVGAVL